MMEHHLANEFGYMNSNPHPQATMAYPHFPMATAVATATVPVSTNMNLMSSDPTHISNWGSGPPLPAHSNLSDAAPHKRQRLDENVAPPFYHLPQQPSATVHVQQPMVHNGNMHPAYCSQPHPSQVHTEPVASFPISASAPSHPLEPTFPLPTAVKTELPHHSSPMPPPMPAVKSSILPGTCLTREIMLQYLAHPTDCVLTLLHAKVAQKSYGNEKRFFCPPPAVYIAGEGWKKKQQSFLALSNSPSNPDVKTAAGSSSSSSTSQTTAESDQGPQLVAFMGIGGPQSHMESVQLHLERGTEHASAKTLFISDSDKRKNFLLDLNLLYSNGCTLGTFHSAKIKVISKPSKKKQSLKNTDLCIASGTKVALFNRLRSQTVSTRYLHVDTDGQFVASGQQWGTFYMHLLDDAEVEREQFPVRSGYIHYGHTIKLVCAKTGLALPRLVVRRVEKTSVVVNADDPVSQLHKCALHLKDSDHMYLGLAQESIVQHQSTLTEQAHRELISDSACWTIISTQKTEFRWCETMGPAQWSITPVPLVHSLDVKGGGESAFVEIKGENFDPNLQVYFREVATKTQYRCADLMLCQVPPLAMFLPPGHNNNNGLPLQKLEVPVILARPDGVVFPSGMTFIYEAEPDVYGTAR